ncbi:MAG: hypothetical protein JW760_14725 [Spirochaetales bacterium]|nr:hypothetical protein [Spirochaetales bacterium]
MDKEELYVGFIHTTPPTIGMVDYFVKQYLPEVVPVHMYNGYVKIENFKFPPGVTPSGNMLRWANFGKELERAGCLVIVSCCSLMPRATEYAARVVSVPFVQLDGIVLDTVIKNYKKVGIINTTPYSVPHIKEEVKRREEKFRKKVVCEFSNTYGALDLFNQGRFDEHDAMVIGDMRRLEKKGQDCILMGQIPFGLMDEQLKNLSLSIPLHYVNAGTFLYLKKLIESDESGHMEL